MDLSLGVSRVSLKRTVESAVLEILLMFQVELLNQSKYLTLVDLLKIGTFSAVNWFFSYMIGSTAISNIYLVGTVTSSA